MLILISVLILSLSALVLLILRSARPKFKYTWLIAAGGAFLALASIFIWQVRSPQTLTLPAWHPFFLEAPAWTGASYSWPYALSLAGLALAIILTSVVRQGVNPMVWAGILVLAVLGIFAVTAENPLALVLTWAAIDLLELLTALQSISSEHSESAVIAFGVRISSIGLVLWASTMSGVTADFQYVPPSAGLYYLLASSLRLGVLPLHFSHSGNPRLRRDLGTILSLVSAASCLALLPYISIGISEGPLTPYLLALAAMAALLFGYLWLRASDEITGRPFWVLGMAALSIAAALHANPIGSIAWGAALILSGGFLSLYSARHRALIWIPLLSAWGLSALPFSPTASGWTSSLNTSWLLWIPCLLAQAFLLAGFFRHATHTGESSIESHPRWAQIIYIVGLIVPPAILLTLGLWGWEGARLPGVWRAALTAVILAAGLSWLSIRFLAATRFGGNVNRWNNLLRLDSFYRAVWDNGLGRISDVITGLLEGDGGILWSLLLLVLLISLAAAMHLI